MPELKALPHVGFDIAGPRGVEFCRDITDQLCRNYTGSLYLEKFQMKNPSIRGNGLPVGRLSIHEDSINVDAHIEDYGSKAVSAEISDRLRDTQAAIAKILEQEGITNRPWRIDGNDVDNFTIKFDDNKSEKVLLILASYGFVPQELAIAALKRFPEQQEKLRATSGAKVAEAEKVLAKHYGFTVEQLRVRLGAAESDSVPAARPAALGARF